MPRRLLIAVLVLAMLATVMAGAGCRSGRTPEISQDFLQLANNQPKNIDPAKASSNPDLEIMRACYETLVEIDPVTMEVVPVLATSWTANDNKIVWTFELRPGVKFHDGSALTAQGVKAALERALSIGAGESYLISSIDTIEAVSERTLKITLKRSEPEFIYAIGRIFIPSAAAIQAHEVDGDRAEAWFAQNEAGSGAFTITKWEKEVEIVLHRFNDYWRGWEGKHLTSVTFRVVAEPGTQRLMMERGDGDFADNIVAEDAEALKNNANLNVLVEVGANPMYIMFNPTGPLADVRVRKAIALAFDYDAMIDDIMLGYTDPLRGPIPERLIGFNNTIQRTQKNLEESRRLLQEAGVTNVTLTFMYFQPWLFEKSAGLLLQEALAPMGVNIEIEAQPWATFVEKARNPQTRPSMGMIAVYVPSPTAGSILRTIFHSSSQGHWAYWGYNNPDIDRLLDQAVVTTDDAERIALYQQVQKIVTEEYAGMWVMNRPDIHVFRNTVKGYRYNPFYPLILNYYDLYKEG